MKVIAVVCFALLIASSFAVGVHNKMTNAQIAKMNSFKNGKSWSSIIINLAELHMMAQGPLDELITAVQEVIDDLNRKLEAADAAYNQRSVEHTDEVRRLNGEIDSANTDIANSETFLETVLYVQKQNLETDISNLNNRIEETRQYIKDQTAIRQQEHAEFEEKTVEHTEAIAALDEALGLLLSLQGGEASLVQVKKAKNALGKVQKKLKNSVESTFIKALVALSSSEFANGDAVRQVGDLMNNVKHNLEDSLAAFTSQEEIDEIHYTEDMNSKEEDILRFQSDIAAKNKILDTTNNQIEETQNFIAIRKADLAGWESDLETENTAFEEATKAYEDLSAEFNKELEVCQEALNFIQNADIAGYIGDRMSSDAPYQAKDSALVGGH